VGVAPRGLDADDGCAVVGEELGCVCAGGGAGDLYDAKFLEALHCAPASM